MEKLHQILKKSCLGLIFVQLYVLKKWAILNTVFIRVRGRRNIDLIKGPSENRSDKGPCKRTQHCWAKHVASVCMEPQQCWHLLPTV